MPKSDASAINAFNKQFEQQGVSFSAIMNGTVDISEKSEFMESVRIAASHIFKDPSVSEDFLSKAVHKRESLQSSIDTFNGTPEEFRRWQGRKIQSDSIEKNIRTVEKFMSGYANPTTANVLGPREKDFFTPYMQPKAGVPMYSKFATTETLFGVTGVARTFTEKAIEKTNNIMESFENSRTTARKGEFVFQGGTVWSGVNSVSLNSPYGKDPISTQGHIEAFDIFQKKLEGNTAPHNRFITFDIETFGNMNTDELFQINEIAVQKWNLDSTTGKHTEGALSSWLLKPTARTEAKMLGVVASLESNPYGFTKLTPDMQRSVMDLMKYSSSSLSSNEAIGVKPAQFIKKDGSVNVIHSNIQDLNQLYDNGNLNVRKAVEMMKVYTPHMKSGLENLKAEGEESKKIMGLYDTFVKNNKSQSFISYNGASFDLPGLDIFGKELGIDITKPKHHVDWMKVIQTSFPDSTDIHKLLGSDLSEGFMKGSQTLESLSNTIFGKNEEFKALRGQAHVASFDIGKFGLGGIINATRDIIQNVLSAGKLKGAPTDPLRRKTSDLEYSQDSLKPGQKFLAMGGTKNFNPNLQDVQVEYIDGKPVLKQFGNNVFNAKSMYELRDIRKVVGEHTYIADFVNTETGVHSMIQRSGEDARYQISQLINQHLELADEMTEGLMDGVTRVQRQDAARRHYDQLFGTAQGTTKGFRAAERFMGNIDILNQNYSGDIADLTPEMKAELASKMNFNSLYKGELNRSEIEKFWEMAPRLQSEAPVFSQFIGRVKEELPDLPAGRYASEYRDHDMKRSLMLNHMIGEMNVEVGGEPLSYRPTLPHEQRALKFKDRLNAGNESRIDITNAKTAMNSINRITYAGEKGEVGERYVSTILGLKESGIMTQAQADAMTADFQNSPGMTPYVHSQVLAKQLAENQAIIEFVEAQNVTVKAASLEARHEVLQIAKAQIDNIMDNGAGIGGRLFGSKTMIPEDIASIFSQLDGEHSLTHLKVNNMDAVQGVIDRINASPHSKGMSSAYTMSKDGHSMFINMFSEYDAERVLGELTNPSRDVTQSINGMLRIELPVLGDQGTIRYNGQYQNARTMIIGEGKETRVLNSQDRFMESLDQKTINSVLGSLRTGKADNAQTLLERRARSSIADLSGIRGNMISVGDSYLAGNSSADIGKQSHIEVHGLVHELYRNNGDFTEGGLQKSAFIDDDYTKGLKTYIPKNALTPVGLSIIEQEEQAYVSRVTGRDNYKSGVKSDNAAITVSSLDLTQSQFHGILSPSTRDNSVQLENSYFYSKEMQEQLGQISTSDLGDTDNKVFVSMADSATTTQRMELDKRISADTGSRMSVDIKTVWMQEDEIVRRTMAMSKTTEGLALLESEGIMKDGKLNHARLPQTHEQQMIVNDEIQKLMVMQKTKHLDIPKDLRLAENIMDMSTGELKIGAEITKGQILAQAFDVHGNAIAGSEVRYKGPRDGRVATLDGRLAVDYMEDVHKIQIGYEKGTFSGGGVRGFSSQFLYALTGVRGVGAVIAPDVLKHSDHDSITGGQLRKLALTINSAEGAEKERLIAAAGRYEIGADLREIDGSYTFIDNIKESGKKTFDMNQVNLLMEESGISKDFYVQNVSMSDVELHSETVGDGRGKVSYTTREQLVLKNQKLEEAYKFVQGEIDESVRANGALNQFKGMISAQNSLVHGTNMEGHTGKIWSAYDFEDTPELDRSNKYLIKGTVLDSAMIQEADGYSRNASSTHGFTLELPQGEGIRLVGASQKPLTHITLPYAEFDERLQDKGDTFYQSKIQKANVSIIRAAKELEAAKYTEGSAGYRKSEVTRASEKLQGLLKSTEVIYRDELTTSDGFANRHVLRARMQNSTAGLTKIVSAAWEEQLSGDHYTMISSVDAKKINIGTEFAHEFGVSKEIKAPTLHDVLAHGQETGKDYFTISSRHPTFHNDALQVTKMFMSDDLKEGYQIISSVIGEQLRADSDGDMNNAISAANKEVQAEFAEKYHSLEGERRVVYGNLLETDEAAARMWDSRQFGNDADGIVSVYDGRDEHIRYTEVMAKHAKGLVGYGSNMDKRYNELANMLYDRNTDDGMKKVATIENFFSGRYGLEARIISAKHKTDLDVVLGNNGGQKLITALSNRQWDLALEIDRDHLGGYFSDTARGNMGAAVDTLKEMEGAIPSDVFRGYGTRLGLRTPNATAEQVADLFTGQSSQFSSHSEFAVQLTRAAGVLEESLETERYAGVGSETAYDERGAPKHQRRAVIDEAPTYRDPGTSRMRDVFENLSTSKVGMGLAIAGGIGLAGLTFSNTTTAVNAFKEDRPHNQADFNNTQASRPAPFGGTQNLARVEMNGEGLSGMEVSISGRSPGAMSDRHLQSLMSGALNSSGVNANLTVNVQDDSSSINKDWLQQQFAQLITNGRV